MIRILLIASAGVFFVQPVSAQSFPPQCTSQFGYSAKCCAASYRKAPQGAMDNNARHAELVACTKREKSKK